MLLAGFGFESKYTAPIDAAGHLRTPATSSALAAATAATATVLPSGESSSSSSSSAVALRRVAICVVLINGHIKAHQVFDNAVKNDIDAEAFIDSVGVLRHAFDAHPSAVAALDFVAIVDDIPAMRKHHQKLERFGWTVKYEQLPVRWNDIQEGFYKNALNTSGCCGITELLKLNVFAMTAYDRVAVVDGDVLIGASLDEIWAAPLWLQLVYTRGQMVGEPFQGGLWAVTPSRDTLADMVSLVQRGAWYEGSGWERSNIGWVYGGPTVQGLMPYYFTKVAPVNASLPLSVCHYNNMGASERCSDTPVEQIRSFHFTGHCDKPFRCRGIGSGDSCRVFTDLWWQYSREIEKKNGFPERPRCKDGHYVPIGSLADQQRHAQQLNMQL